MWWIFKCPKLRSPESSCAIQNFLEPGSRFQWIPNHVTTIESIVHLETGAGDAKVWHRVVCRETYGLSRRNYAQEKGPAKQHNTSWQNWLSFRL